MAAGLNTTAPIATIAGANTGINNSFGITVDATGDIFVTNGANVTEYAPGANGNVAPIAVLGGSNTAITGPNSVAVNAGVLFVSDSSGKILEFPLPLGSSSLASPDNTAPTVTLSGAATGLRDPTGMVFDSSGNLFVANNANNSVTGYAPSQYTTTGDPTPYINIAGSNTGLGGVNFITLLNPTAPTPLAVVNTGALPGAVIGHPYSQTLAATGGTGPYTWGLAAGSGPLPDGLTLSSAGVISGTPTAASTASFTVEATDSSTPTPQTATSALTLTVGGPLTITTTSPLPGAQVGNAYSQALAATGAVPPYTWTLVTGSGPLPDGLTLNSDGTITGTPTTVGTSTFTAQVADSSTPALTATQAFSLTVTVPPLVITTTSPLPDANVNSSYFTSLTASGGTGADTWALAPGSNPLPVGITLTPDGTISGTPTVEATSTFTVQVTDSGSPAQTATMDLSLTVGPPQLIITSPPTLPGGTVGAAYSQTLTVTGGTPPFTFSMVDGFGIVPSGLTLDPNTGVISGTPTFAGTFDFQVQVADSGNPQQTNTSSFEINIKEGPPFAPGSVVSWGLNSADQLGNGLTPPNTSRLDAPNPVSLPAGVTAVQIAAGQSSGYALTADGHVYAWGFNASGELGIGTRGAHASAAVPVEVCAVGGCANGKLSGITAISAGSGWALALTSTGQLVAWGSDNQGQVGNGTATFFGVTTPVAVSLPAGTTVTAISAGGANGLAVTSTGAVLSWGGNNHGQIGNGTSGSNPAKSPVFVCAVGGCANGNLSGVTSVSAGQGNFALAVTSTGAVLGWGDNGQGQLGDGTSGADVLLPTTAAIPAGDTVAAVSAGTYGSLALTSTGQVLSWGYLNGHGSSPGLGNGDTNGSATPVALSLPAITAISTGSFIGDNMVLTSTGTVLAWGDNSDGELGQGTGYGLPPSLTPVAVVMPAGTVIAAIGAAGQYNLALVGAAPAITSAPAATFTVGAPGSFTVTATGTPPPTITESGALPAGVTFTNGVLSGTPAPGTGGDYPLVFTATGAGSPATQDFTLTVDEVTPSTGGYTLVASDGGVFNFGDAGFFGSMGAKHLNRPVVGIASTPDGAGYWLVASDGGVFNFGDAGFYGSMGDKHLNRPVVGMASTADGGGYWLVASDGGIFTFGDAGFYGSMGDKHLNAPAVGMAPTPDGGGYWIVATDGGIFTFGDATFLGSMGDRHLNRPVVGMTADPF
ncbi:MAG TPA: putative Ig domain-containing protein [Acidimicrobiales bacterium]|nr:putative Ig domain-containing protein [Acidimicrobiales bacterium]